MIGLIMPLYAYNKLHPTEPNFQLSTIQSFAYYFVIKIIIANF